MEFVKIMVKDIASFTIIANILLSLIGNEDYKKYIKIFCGVLLIIIMINPFIKLLKIVEDVNSGKFIEKKVYNSANDIVIDYSEEDVNEKVNKAIDKILSSSKE